MTHDKVAPIPTARITSGCSKRLSSKATASEEARRTLRYVEPLSDARTPLADFFSILLGRKAVQAIRQPDVFPIIDRTIDHGRHMLL